MRMSQVLQRLREEEARHGPRLRLMQRYSTFLPLTPATPPLSLGEGLTPLIHARQLGRAMGCPSLYLKFEGTNPTGSFKDRGMVVAVAKAMERGARSIICASTGNTSAAAAAYGAAAGLEVVVILPEGRIATGKLLQAQVAGARVLQIAGNFDDALRIVRELTDDPDPAHPVALVNSVNPDRLEGQKTAAFEVCEDLGGAPDHLAIPVGNAGNISAYWQGFTEYRDAGFVDTVPVMLGFQAEGAAPLVLGHPVAQPETVATAIRIGAPASADKARAARDESGGRIDTVTDEQILAAQQDLARMEGVFCEPASAASVAGVRKLAADGAIDPGATIVCVLTGHGLKDPDTPRSWIAPTLSAQPTVTDIRRVLGW